MINLERKKKRNILLSISYKLQKLIFLPPQKKLKLFLNLSWIFSRLAHEQIIKNKMQLPNSEEDDFLLNHIEYNANVLDIGCGEGYVEERLILKTKNIVGIDYNIHSLEIAKNKFKNSPSIQFYCMDVFKYLDENINEKVDVIILSHILEHLDNPAKFLMNLTEKAKYFYIEVPDFEANHLNLYRQVLSCDLIYTDADHVTEFDRKSLERIIANTGFTILNQEFRLGVMKYWCSHSK